jgi:hypothetical protein
LSAVRLAADQANEVVGLNGAPNGHRGLGLLFCRRLDFSANVGHLAANGGDERGDVR